eukprot:3451557-Amphidinium_carterae.1
MGSCGILQRLFTVARPEPNHEPEFSREVEPSYNDGYVVAQLDFEDPFSFDDVSAVSFVVPCFNACAMQTNPIFAWCIS